jgi:Fe-S-cluster containining protein
VNEKQKKREKKKAAKAKWQSHKEQKRIDAIIKEQMARIPLQMVKEEAVERQCGECQACCEVIGVHELKKENWTKCQHQCSSGCGIYEERPESCKTYYCLWQAGMMKGGVENRPDNLGVIFDFRAITDGNDKEAISVWELREGAVDEPRPKEMIEEISKHFILCIRRYKSSRRRIIGPAYRMKELVTVTEYN